MRLGGRLILLRLGAVSNTFKEDTGPECSLGKGEYCRRLGGRQKFPRMGSVWKIFREDTKPEYSLGIND